MHSFAHNHYDSMSNQYPIVNVFRALGMEPHVCGHRHLSALLLVFSYTVMLLSVGFAYYVFVAIRLFGKYSNVDEVISSILCVGLFVANISCTLHAIVRRRQLADILPAIQRLDVLMCNEFNWTARRRTLMSAKYTVRLLVFVAMIGSTMFFYVSVVSWDIAYVVFICLGIRVRCLQLTFYVHQLHARLLQLNAEMRRGCIVTAEAADHDSVMDDARCSGLCRAYDAIWNISERINDSFGWSTLSVAADATLVAVVKTYLVFKLHVYFCLAELVPTLVTFAVVCWTCDDCAQTVNALTDVYRQDVIPIERWINLWRAIGGRGVVTVFGNRRFGRSHQSHHKPRQRCEIEHAAAIASSSTIVQPAAGPSADTVSCERLLSDQPAVGRIGMYDTDFRIRLHVSSLVFRYSPSPRRT